VRIGRGVLWRPVTRTIGTGHVISLHVREPDDLSEEVRADPGALPSPLSIVVPFGAESRPTI
jgi:hypothetical protein